MITTKATGSDVYVLVNGHEGNTVAVGPFEDHEAANQWADNVAQVESYGKVRVLSPQEYRREQEYERINRQAGAR